MNMGGQRKVLMRRLKQLQILIDTEVDATFKDALNREKTECLKQIMTLTSQTPTTQLTNPNPISSHIHTEPTRSAINWYTWHHED